MALSWQGMCCLSWRTYVRVRCIETRPRRRLLRAIWCVSMSLRRFGSRGVPKSSQVIMRVMVVIACVNGRRCGRGAADAKRMRWTRSGREEGQSCESQCWFVGERETREWPHPQTHRRPSWLHRARARRERERERERWPKRRFDSVPRRTSVDLTPLSC